MPTSFGATSISTCRSWATTLPSSWLITLDAALSFSMLVAVAAFWKWWSLKHHEPDEISKMIIGSLFTIAGGALPVHGGPDSA